MFKMKSKNRKKLHNLLIRSNLRIKKVPESSSVLLPKKADSRREMKNLEDVVSVLAVEEAEATRIT